MRTQEVGWEKYSLLSMLGWESQWLAYSADVHARVMRPAFTVPVFDRDMTGTTRSVTLPR